jgi:hypothetical protein
LLVQRSAANLFAPRTLCPIESVRPGLDLGVVKGAPGLDVCQRFQRQAIPFFLQCDIRGNRLLDNPPLRTVEVLRQAVELERLCRYISRPAVSQARLSLTPGGLVRYQLKTPYSEGTTHVLFEPLDFIARLSALAAQTARQSHPLPLRVRAEQRAPGAG